MTFQELIDYFGSQVAAAGKLGLTQPTLSNWKARGHIPHLAQLKIQHFTRGKLKAAPEVLAKKVSRP